MHFLFISIKAAKHILTSKDVAVRYGSPLLNENKGRQASIQGPAVFKAIALTTGPLGIRLESG